MIIINEKYYPKQKTKAYMRTISKMKSKTITLIQQKEHHMPQGAGNHKKSKPAAY